LLSEIWQGILFVPVTTRDNNLFVLATVAAENFDFLSLSLSHCLLLHLLLNSIDAKDRKKKKAKDRTRIPILNLFFSLEVFLCTGSQYFVNNLRRVTVMS